MLHCKSIIYFFVAEISDNRLWTPSFASPYQVYMWSCSLNYVFEMFCFCLLVLNHTFDRSFKTKSFLTFAICSWIVAREVTESSKSLLACSFPVIDNRMCGRKVFADLLVRYIRGQ